jgi:hypothetical protein
MESSPVFNLKNYSSDSYITSAKLSGHSVAIGTSKGLVLLYSLDAKKIIQSY